MAISIKRPGPLVQMTMALVALCAMLVLLADLFLGVIVNREDQTVQLRKHVGESLAVQVVTLVQSANRENMTQIFEKIASGSDQVRSLAIRRSDGKIVLQTAGHSDHWVDNGTHQSSDQQMIVPLRSSSVSWGTFEVAFNPPPGNVVTRWLGQPVVLMLMFLFAAGMPLFFLYMRRALQHLDPSSVIPDRVQGAFDAMTESVVVLDARGRVLLASQSFHDVHSQAQDTRPGMTLSSMPWLLDALPDDSDEHPWSKSMSDNTNTTGETIIVGDGEDQRQLVINCAPITDPGGNVRGCLVTFSDVTELHRANAALRASMAALSESKQEVQAQNHELQRLATRDPLTGCLNRRALHDSLQRIESDARGAGLVVSCVMVDIDKFKIVNDTHGHAVGDRVIQEVAKNLYASVRSTDLVCRYGGEEFCVVLQDASLEVATRLAERARARIEQRAGQGVREVDNMHVTVSLGVNTMVGQEVNLTKLIDGADHALYRAKRSGRNRVCQFNSAAGHDNAIHEDNELVDLEKDQ